MRSPFVGTFIHDDWKINRDVTLNLGLRYEWESAPYDDNDIYSRFLDLSAPNQAMQKARRQFRQICWLSPRRNLTAPGYSPTATTGKPFATQKNIFLPRVGVAIRVNDKTAINVGFARYAVPVVVGNNATVAPIRSRHVSGARDSTRRPIRCRSSKAGRRRTCRIHFPRQLQSSAVAGRQEPRRIYTSRQSCQLGRSGLQAADQRSHQLHDHARDPGPVQSGRDLVHEHRPQRAAQLRNRTWRTRTSAIPTRRSSRRTSRTRSTTT